MFVACSGWAKLFAITQNENDGRNTKKKAIPANVFRLWGEKVRVIPKKRTPDPDKIPLKIQNRERSPVAEKIEKIWRIAICWGVKSPLNTNCGGNANKTAANIDIIISCKTAMPHGFIYCLSFC